MKSTILILVVLLFCSINIEAQSTFQQGWYIVEKGAIYGVYAPGSLDFSKKGKQDDINELTIGVGEVVFIWEQSNGLYIGNEWFGRISIFKSLDKLTKAPETGKIAYLEKDIDDLEGKVMSAGSAVWVTDFNTATKTVKVVLAGGKKYEIPATDITLLASYIVREGQSFIQYKKAN